MSPWVVTCLFSLSESSTVSDDGAGGNDFNMKYQCHIYHRVDAQLLCQIMQLLYVSLYFFSAALRQKLIDRSSSLTSCGTRASEKTQISC